MNQYVDMWILKYMHIFVFSIYNGQNLNKNYFTRIKLSLYFILVLNGLCIDI